MNSPLKPVKAEDIYSGIFNHRNFIKRYEFVIPNCYYHKRCEADLLCLTKSGYLMEYEVKVSKQDFLNDRKKTFRITKKDLKILGVELDNNMKPKYEWLSLGLLKPNYFSYIVPHNLISVEDIPDFCGLYYISGNVIKEIQKPKILHKRKISLKEKYELCRKLAVRLFSRIVK